MDKQKNNKQRMTYTMCSNKTCCPVITEIDDNSFTITDDYQGKVILTREELNLLKNYLNENLKD